MSVFIFQPFWLQHPKKRFTSPLPGELVAFLLAKGVGIPWPHAVERTWVAKDAGGERTWVARFVRTNLDCKECGGRSEGRTNLGCQVRSNEAGLQRSHLRFQVYSLAIPGRLTGDARSAHFRFQVGSLAIPGRLTCDSRSVHTLASFLEGPATPPFSPPAFPKSPPETSSESPTEPTPNRPQTDPRPTPDRPCPLVSLPYVT